MFTGIVEEVGKVVAVSDHGTNRDLVISARMTPELRVDQSVSHNGVCLTVVRIDGERYTVTAVQETMDRSNIGSLSTGDLVNLERSLRVGDRLDGHMVQGHVDTVVECTLVEDVGGSWRYRFRLPQRPEMLVLKGSICINGVSLTIAEMDQAGFGVAIIPYTHEHTNFHALAPGHKVNIEYDVLGKYVERMLGARVIP
jgi:riboflavin synthase